ncbi:Rap family tetratricopeptide repeat protein [Bacillus changyiensis]|uniref:Rap family tetratricopeptide repeat protein n=1 Tax=Bacillus changyiensis TaxID=3004103 RepID=UPI0022E1E7D2|nr:Rap family tetratricopeptide repeat protein [Bacillus changyiensis]MDA1475782.1 tetratricopeptide repeat protein [Bacillus changyiensis]
MDQLIPSSKVGVKIHEWYKMVRQFSVPDAEVLKSEVEKEIHEMEEDQDLLLYYQLMCFRHQLMLDYLEPTEERKNRPSIEELLRQIEEPRENLNGLLQYYSFFFRGMYEFEQKQYISAIQFYRNAEKQLSYVPDVIEKAEFHFKIAEAYYNMKQNHVSMYHILRALKIYDNHELYTIRRIQCLFIIAGNYDDFKCHDKALPHLNSALELAKQQENQRLISSAYFNLADCYDCMGDLDTAVKYAEKAVEINIKQKYNNLPHSLYFFSQLLFKQKNYKHALKMFHIGIQTAQEYKDSLFTSLFEFLEALYIYSANKTEILKVFKYLDKNKIYAYMERLSFEVSNWYLEREDYQNSNEFLRKMIYAQTQIKKGDCLYEY